MDEQAKTEAVVVYKFKSQKERDDFELAMQWPEDRARFLRLISPTPANELNKLFKD